MGSRTCMDDPLGECEFREDLGLLSTSLVSTVESDEWSLFVSPFRYSKSIWGFWLVTSDRIPQFKAITLS